MGGMFTKRRAIMGLGMGGAVLGAYAYGRSSGATGVPNAQGYPTGMYGM